MTFTQKAVEAALDAADYIPNPDNRKWMRAALEAALAVDGLALVPRTISDADLRKLLGRDKDSLITPMFEMFREFYEKVVAAANDGEERR